MMAKQMIDSEQESKNFPQTYRIDKKVEEADNIFSLYFETDEIAKEAKPGQFLMVWK